MESQNKRIDSWIRGNIQRAKRQICIFGTWSLFLRYTISEYYDPYYQSVINVFIVVAFKTLSLQNLSSLNPAFLILHFWKVLDPSLVSSVRISMRSCTVSVLFSHPWRNLYLPLSSNVTFSNLFNSSGIFPQHCKAMGG